MGRPRKKTTLPAHPMEAWLKDNNLSYETLAFRLRAQGFRCGDSYPREWIGRRKIPGYPIAKYIEHISGGRLTVDCLLNYGLEGLSYARKSAKV